MKHRQIIKGRLYRITLQIILILINLKLCVSIERQNQGSHGTSLLSLVTGKDSFDTRRPIIHTFILEDDITPIFQQDELIRLWAESWSDAGWNPVVLTKKDAMQHPDYDNINSKLIDAEIEKFDRFGRYLRYVAMSLVPEGGWYSEPYVMPLPSDYLNKVGFELPNNGKFTLHDNELPELLSGDQKEWDKMLFYMTQKPDRNDVMMLSNFLSENPDLYVTQSSIINGKYALDSKISSSYCKHAERKIAVKFSYRIAKDAGINRSKFYTAVKSSLASLLNKKCKFSDNKVATPARDLPMEPVTNTLNEKLADLSLNKMLQTPQNASKKRISDNSRTIHTFVMKEDDPSKLNELNEFLKIWTESWSDAGWDTVVLTEKDASRHPIYRNFVDKLSKVNFDKRSRWGRYLRFIAMATIPDGGWYSEPHVLPLRSNEFIGKGLEVPNDGKFTTYHSEFPELLSGNQREWNRMAIYMNQKPEKDDMSILKNLHRDFPGLYEIQNNHVIDSKYVLNSKLNGELCEQMDKETLAARFSYRVAKEAGIKRSKYYDAVKSSLASLNADKCRLSATNIVDSSRKSLVEKLAELGIKY